MQIWWKYWLEYPNQVDILVRISKSGELSVLGHLNETDSWTCTFYKSSSVVI